MDRTMPRLNEQLCSRCGLCISACPCGSVELAEERVVFACPEACKSKPNAACDCGCVCEEVCPTGAISVAFEIVLGEEQQPKTSRGKAHGQDL